VPAESNADFGGCGTRDRTTCASPTVTFLRAASAFARSSNDPTSTIHTRLPGELTARTRGVGSPAAFTILERFVARVRAAVSVPKTPALTVHGASDSGSGRGVGAGIAGFGAGTAGTPAAAALRDAATCAAASRACSRASSASRPRSFEAAAEYADSASAHRRSSTAMLPCITSARPATTGSELFAAIAKEPRASSARPSSCAAHPAT
jgi:hypothetical protein